LFLAKGPREAAYAIREYNISPENVVVVGQPRIDKQVTFSSTNSPSFSRSALGLSQGRRRYIGYDPNASLRGFQSSIEQYQTLATLIRIAQRESDVLIVVKPHPSYSIEHLHSEIVAVHLRNVVVLARNSPVEHFLNACDVIITKYSALILESALMQRPAVSVLFDGEDRFKVYGDLPEIARTPQELEALLQQIVTDDDAFVTWRRLRLAHQQAVLPEFLHRSHRDPAEASAEAILQHLDVVGDKTNEPAC
jgi:CDP-glycerol glycerophosphotransferase (TagB/SpsB family)